MSRKNKKQQNRSEKTPRTAVAPEQPAAPDQTPAPETPADDHLTGQIARGAASGAARSITDWIIEQITEHFG
ncbi:hypothetical protein [Streptomyces sp. NRRL B-24484]|uniref:hypothetical protein n=1 Tax=Streptomyces sp. NRRL B-24484 TaxID=1463833 RepID=UPI0004C2A865|nr:hypothetical protein [Streptomyces sp. NRRL B-24484]